MAAKAAAWIQLPVLRGGRCFRSSKQMRMKSRHDAPYIIKSVKGKGAAAASESGDGGGCEEEDLSYSVLTALRTQHNDIVVVDSPKSRFLLLDSSHDVHSMLNKEQKWTGSCWDEFAVLPAIIPQGPVAMFGLAGGTAAHLMLDMWPSLQIIGWEIDQIVIDMAREYFNLSDIEKCTKAGGSLTVMIGDALSPSAVVPGGFAGIIVDLFAEGKILPQLQEVSTWLDFEKRLMPEGRILVNCGGAHNQTAVSIPEEEDIRRISQHSDFPKDVDSWTQNLTIRAMQQAFPGKVIWKRISDKETDNDLALTGPIPNLNAWSAALPGPLASKVNGWRPCLL